MTGPMPDPAHDPGGKVKTVLPAGMKGGAAFYGDRREYRSFLWRSWDNDAPENARADWLPYALWIGMNPSTADAEHNDPTITREIGFTRRELLTCYAKTNVMDFRATKPSVLLSPGVSPCSYANESIIRLEASRASLIVLAFGALPPKLLPYALRVVSALEDGGHTLHCLGTTKAGWPRHPLYVRGDTPLEVWQMPVK